MNRFILHPNPIDAARQHCDRHVVKMIVEEAQMLSTVQRQHGNDDPRLYKTAYANHPCTVWAGETRDNYLWAWQLLVALCEEYTYRYGKIHATAAIIKPLAALPDFPPRTLFSIVPQAMPKQYRHPDPVTAYRRFYIAEKARFATWRKRPQPNWWPL